MYFNPVAQTMLVFDGALGKVKAIFILSLACASEMSRISVRVPV